MAKAKIGNGGDSLFSEETPPPPASAERLRVARLRLEHVLGVEEHTVDLSGVTVLSGANASGKSSHLKALRAGLGIDRTSLVRLQRVGEAGTPAENSEPRVEILLRSEDGSREVQVTRRGSGSPEVRERVGEDWRKVARPVEWLRDLIDVTAANPAAWLAANDEERAAMLLEAMPLSSYSREAALAAAGLEGFKLPPIPRGLHPLEELEQIEGAVFGSRTETNRQRDREHDAAQQLLAGLPAEPPEDPADLPKLDDEERALSLSSAATKERADAERSAIVGNADADLVLARERISGTFKAKAANLRSEHEKVAAEIRATAERQIAEDLRITEASINEARQAGETELADAETARNLAVDAADRAHGEAMAAQEEQREKIARLRERIASLQSAHEAVATDRHVRAKAEEGEARASEWAAKSERLTNALQALKRYKLELTSALPIKGLGLEFNDKGKPVFRLDGVPLAQVNDGRLAELATEVSLLRSSEPPEDGRPYLPIVLLDGIEKLDSKARDALLRRVADSQAQVIAACVTDGPLRCLSVGDAA